VARTPELQIAPQDGGPYLIKVQGAQMRRGERVKKPASAAAAAEQAPIGAAIGRLWTVLGGLDGPGMRARLALALGLTLIAKVFIVAAPLVLADAVNALAAEGREALSGFVTAVCLWAALRFIGAGAPQLRDGLFQPVSEEAQRRVGLAVFSHVHALSIRFHQSKRTGALHRTIERGVRAIDFLLRFLAFNIGPTVFELALAAGVLGWRYGATFSAIAVGTVLVYAGVTFAITNWRLEHRRRMNEADGEASARAVDSLLNFETVKAFAAEGREAARFDQSLRAYAAAAVRSNTGLALLNGTQNLVQNVGLALMVAATGFVIADGAMGPGDVAAVTLVMLNLYAPLNVLGFAYREIRQSAIDMETMYAVLDERPDVADRPDARALHISHGAIAFEDVRFSHDGRQAGLDGVSFRVPPGTTTAIVGASGAGKSTILKLLFRFYDPASGRIVIDDQDIAAVTQTSLRGAIGLVPQDVVLFNDTLAYNIAYGRPEASRAEVEAAARAAQLDGLLANAPAGLDTRVGERGLKLSGGEKQRVGIARVLLADPPILVLDEATSSLDSATEAEVQAQLDAMSTDRTTLVVAHRLSTIADADQILVLKDGRIVERGRHADLVALGGGYAALWTRQAEAPDAAQGLAPVHPARAPA
jgi:ATP-binding cassette subfamily B protein